MLTYYTLYSKTIINFVCWTRNICEAILFCWSLCTKTDQSEFEVSFYYFYQGIPNWSFARELLHEYYIITYTISCHTTISIFAYSIANVIHHFWMITQFHHAICIVDKPSCFYLPYVLPNTQSIWYKCIEQQHQTC